MCYTGHSARHQLIGLSGAGLSDPGNVQLPITHVTRLIATARHESPNVSKLCLELDGFKHELRDVFDHWETERATASLRAWWGDSLASFGRGACDEIHPVRGLARLPGLQTTAANVTINPWKNTETDEMARNARKMQARRHHCVIMTWDPACFRNGRPGQGSHLQSLPTRGAITRHLGGPHAACCMFCICIREGYCGLDISVNPRCAGSEAGSDI
jgi:hypothetical protein